ncbi:hypothetical protein F383_35515 [Gossypium arboreum]|uniref:Uncharacterized protein n=1 Tax=Gossypium arboreum TaxID=29729 RepID=A0A0B0N702_GOSAR|nr:hypothetical protein F383_35515 [Gossypium arboreum]
MTIIHPITTCLEIIIPQIF